MPGPATAPRRHSGGGGTRTSFDEDSKVTPDDVSASQLAKGQHVEPPSLLPPSSSVDDTRSQEESAESCQIVDMDFPDDLAELARLWLDLPEAIRRGFVETARALVSRE